MLSLVLSSDSHVFEPPICGSPTSMRRSSGSQLVGEMPSATLRRPPDDPRPRRNIGSPWRLAETA
jgi:hypothetical protein